MITLKNYTPENTLELIRYYADTGFSREYLLELLTDLSRASKEFTLPLHKRTPEQLNRTRNGLCWAISGHLTTSILPHTATGRMKYGGGRLGMYFLPIRADNLEPYYCMLKWKRKHDLIRASIARDHVKVIKYVFKITNTPI